MSDTPDSQVMMQHIKSVCEKWKDVSNSKGNTVFTPQTASEINNLKKHIKSGCLSEIPPPCTDHQILVETIRDY